MTYNELLKTLNNKIYHPVYLLQGEESYYIDKIIDIFIDNVLSEFEKEFNLTVLYGRDVEAGSLVAELKGYPMSSNYKLVIIKEAQSINKKDHDKLAEYIKNPLKTTIFVLAYKYGSIDGRTGLAREIKSKGVIFDSPKLKQNKIPGWINDYIKSINYKISDKAATILAELLGDDLSKIVNEINKIIINLQPGAEINPEIVLENIGISKDYNIFELQNAIINKNLNKAWKIINYFVANIKEEPIVVNIGFLYSFFVKILTYHYLQDKSQSKVAAALGVPPFYIKDYITAASHYSPSKIINIISYLKECDLKSKGINNPTVSEVSLYKELIYKILH